MREKQINHVTSEILHTFNEINKLSNKMKVKHVKNPQHLTINNQTVTTDMRPEQLAEILGTSYYQLDPIRFIIPQTIAVVNEYTFVLEAVARADKITSITLSYPWECADPRFIAAYNDPTELSQLFLQYEASIDDWMRHYFKRSNYQTSFSIDGQEEFIYTGPDFTITKIPCYGEDQNLINIILYIDFVENEGGSLS